jgi:hypothetical protein
LRVSFAKKYFECVNKDECGCVPSKSLGGEEVADNKEQSRPNKAEHASMPGIASAAVNYERDEGGKEEEVLRFHAN